MPSKSEKQARTMRAAVHDPKFAKKVGIPKDVAEEFVEADKKKAAKKTTASKEDHTARASISTRYRGEA